MAQLTELNDKQRQIATQVQWLDAPSTPFTSQLSLKPELVDYKFDQPVEEYRRLGFKGKMDGEDVKVFNSQTSDVISCHSMKFSEGVAVSDFTQKTKTATVAKNGQFIDQVNKANVVLKHSLEAAFCSNQEAAQNDVSTNTPHRTRGVFAWAEKGTDGFEPIPKAKYCTPDAQRFNGPLSGLDDDLLKKIGAALFTSRRGGQTALKLFAGIELKGKFTDLLAYQKQAPTGYVNSVMTTVNGEKKEVVKIVDFVEVDGVTIEIHPTAFNLLNPEDGEDTAYTTKSGFAVDMGMVGYAYQDTPHATTLENKSGGPRGYVQMIAMFICKNPKALVTFKSNALAA